MIRKNFAQQYSKKVTYRNKDMARKSSTEKIPHKEYQKELALVVVE